MPLPKTMEEAEARAHAKAVEAVEVWEKRDQSLQHLNDFAIEEYQDTYSYWSRVYCDLMGDRLGNGISRHAQDLIELCRHLRYETDAPSTFGIAIAAIIEIADKRYDDVTPDLALRDIVASLVGSFGADKVRAAIDQN